MAINVTKLEACASFLEQAKIPGVEPLGNTYNWKSRPLWPLVLFGIIETKALDDNGLLFGSKALVYELGLRSESDIYSLFGANNNHKTLKESAAGIRAYIAKHKEPTSFDWEYVKSNRGCYKLKSGGDKCRFISGDYGVVWVHRDGMVEPGNDKKWSSPEYKFVKAAEPTIMVTFKD